MSASCFWIAAIRMYIAAYLCALRECGCVHTHAACLERRRRRRKTRERERGGSKESSAYAARKPRPFPTTLLCTNKRTYVRTSAALFLAVPCRDTAKQHSSFFFLLEKETQAAATAHAFDKQTDKHSSLLLLFFFFFLNFC